MCKGKNNLKDPYAVAVMRDNVVVGHLPRKISRICTLAVSSIPPEGRKYMHLKRAMKVL